MPFRLHPHPLALDDFLTAYLTEDGALHHADQSLAAWSPRRPLRLLQHRRGPLAAPAIADATDAAFAAFSARVLVPLGLSGGWGHLDPPGPGAVTLYTCDKTGAFDALPPHGLATWPDGQYTASARDLAKLLAVVMGGGVFDGERLTEREVVELLTTLRIDGLARPDGGVGLFWSTETHAFGTRRARLEGHPGGDPRGC